MSDSHKKPAVLAGARQASHFRLARWTRWITDEDLARRGVRAPSATSAFPANSLSRAASIPRCIAAACGRCASTPASATAAESNQRYRYLLRAGRKGLSVAFDLPTQIGMDSDNPLALGEVGKVGVAIDSLEDMRTLFDGIPLDRVSTSMTINSTAAILLALYVAVGKTAGRGSAAALRHGAERHPEGIHRARDVHLSAAPRDAHRHGYFRVVPPRGAQLECDFDFRVSHSRSGIDGRAGSGVHARQRNRVRGGGGRRRARGGRIRAAAFFLLQRAQRISRCKSRSSARRGACGRASCATASAQKIRAR